MSVRYTCSEVTLISKFSLPKYIHMWLSHVPPSGILRGTMNTRPCFSKKESNSIHHHQTSTYPILSLLPQYPFHLIFRTPQLGSSSAAPHLLKSSFQAPILPTTVHDTYPKRHSIYRVLFINVPHNTQSINPCKPPTPQRVSMRSLPIFSLSI